jgi:hypothetical protein
MQFFSLVVCGSMTLSALIFLPSECLARNTPGVSEQNQKEVGQATVQILPPSEGTLAIESLTFKKASFPLVKVDTPGSPSQMFVFLEGSYPHQNASLLIRPLQKIVSRSKVGGNFRVRVPISEAKTPLTFTSIDAWGHTLSTPVLIEIPEWTEIQTKLHEGPGQSRFHWHLNAGLTHLDYSQGGSPEISSWLISTRAGVEYWLAPDKWNLSLSGYFTPLPLTTTPSGYSILFLGINARVGYVVPGITAPWRLTLMAGVYYATTYSSATSSSSGVAPLGYVNIAGPELYPTLSRTFSSGSSMSTYFKFSPVSDQFTLLSFSNREIASGLSYNFVPNSAGRNFSLTFDWANLTVQEAGVQASSTTLSFGAGYRW